MTLLPMHMPWLNLFWRSSAVYETAIRQQPPHREELFLTPLGRDLLHRVCKKNVLDFPFLRKLDFKNNHKLQKWSRGFVYKWRSGLRSKRKNFLFFFSWKVTKKVYSQVVSSSCTFPPPRHGRLNSVCTNTEPAMGEVNSQLLLDEIQKWMNAAHLHQT